MRITLLLLQVFWTENYCLCFQTFQHFLAFKSLFIWSPNFHRSSRLLRQMVWAHAATSHPSNRWWRDTRCHGYKRKKLKNIIRILIDVIHSLDRQNLSFGGRNEYFDSKNQGNFLETVKLIAEYNHVMNKHHSDIQLSKNACQHTSFW